MVLIMPTTAVTANRRPGRTIPAKPK
jgi:hypothetical protein